MLIALAVSLAALLPPGPTSAQAPAARFEFAQPHMGTTFRIVLFAPDSAGAAAAAGSAFAVIADLDGRLSDWNPHSELSRLAEVAGTGEGRRVSRELWDALSLARDWAERTDGAFDPTVGPLTRLWRWSARRGELPDPGRLADAREAVGWENLRLDGADDARIVGLERPAMSLDLGGIAKGIAADAALAELARRGLPSALVDAGGDIAVGAPPPGKEGWRIEIEREGHGRGQSEGSTRARPAGRILSNVGVATSGATHRYFEADGARYSHIVDPRTGLGVTEPRTVTVVALDAATADVLASALSVLDAAAGAALVASEPGAWVVGPQGGPAASRGGGPGVGRLPAS